MVAYFVLSIIIGIPLVLFWAAILSYVPMALYLLVVNPPLYYADAIQARGIFILNDEEKTKKKKRFRGRFVSLIYGTSAFLLQAVYFWNAGHQQMTVSPFDIIASTAMLIFSLAVITYLPAGYLVSFQRSVYEKTSGICLTRTFVGYGIGVLLFSLVFFLKRIKGVQMTLGTDEILFSLMIIFIVSLTLAYLPTLMYIFLNKTVFPEGERLHPNIIFVIYSVCFLSFSTIYICNIMDKKLNIQSGVHSAFR